MKKRIFTSTEFVPRIIQEDAVVYLEHLRQRLEDALVTRYPNIDIDISDVSVSPGAVTCNVTIRNGGRFTGNYPFQFRAYSDYFDESDYLQHLNQTRIRFVDSILH